MALNITGLTYYGGGIIFHYTNIATTTGLIVSTIDLNNVDGGAAWSNWGKAVPGGTSTAIGTGAANTVAILSGFSNSAAAYYCSNLVYSGKSDWYLPSKDELNELYLAKDMIGGLDGQYWSSSEYNVQEAWKQDFTDTNSGTTQGHSYKFNTFKVRAIRSF